MSGAPIAAIFRASASEPWQDAEIIARHPDGLVLREVGKLWPGVWVAPPELVRVTTDLVLDLAPWGGNRAKAAA